MLRTFKIAPGNFVEPPVSSNPSKRTKEKAHSKKRYGLFRILGARGRIIKYVLYFTLRAALRALKIAPGNF